MNTTRRKVRKTRKKTQNKTQKRKGGGRFYRYTLTKLADKWNKKSKRLVKKTGLKADQFIINCTNRDECIKSSKNISAFINKQENLTEEKKQVLIKKLKKFENKRRNFR
jgi:hypothetical protein